MRRLDSKLRLLIIASAVVFGIATTAPADDLDSIWARTYDGPASGYDVPVAAATDAAGNVFVAAYSDGIATGRDFVILKYSTAGVLLWERRFDGGSGGNDRPFDLDIAPTGTIYVTGSSVNGAAVAEFYTIAMNSDGDTLWTRRFPGIPGLGAVASSLDPFRGPGGGVCVAGYTIGAGTIWDMLIIRYNSAGDTVWARTFVGSGTNLEEARDVVTDQLGNVYVTGYGWITLLGECVVTIKYDVNGQAEWIKAYNGPGSNADRGEAIAIDDQGSVFVVGDSWDGGSSDIVTISWDVNGNENWSRRYNGPGNGNDFGAALGVDNLGNVYVTGSSLGDTTSIDIVTLKYSASGTLQWSTRYSSGGALTDRARDLSVDIGGRPFVVGSENDQMVSLQHDTEGAVVWTARYKAPTQFDDEAIVVSPIPTGGIYTLGTGYDASGEENVVTIRYSVNLPPELSEPGEDDVDEDNCLLTQITALDPEGDTITLSLIPTSVPNVAFVDSGDGIGGFTFCPDYEQSGEYDFQFTASDGILNDTVSYHVLVNNVNRPPVVTDPAPQQVSENAILEFRIEASDPDGQVPSLESDNLPLHATLVDSGNAAGSIMFAPDFDQSGTHFINIIASDGLLADTGVAQIAVINVNRAPQLMPTDPQSVNEGDTLSLRLSALDPDLDPLTFQVEDLPANAVFADSGNGAASLIFMPDYDQSGEYSVRIITDDGDLSDSIDLVISVLNVNRPPIVTPIFPQQVNEGELLTVHVVSHDLDGEIPSLMAENLPLHADFADSGNGNGALNFTPDYDQSGDYTINIVASDGDLTDTAQLAITVLHVNRSPQVESVAQQFVDEAEALTFAWSATDPDSDSLVLTAVDLPANATMVDSGNGAASISFTPDYSQAGDYLVTLIAADSGLADTTTVTITVNNVCICNKIHGEVTEDGVINILDAVFLIDFVFRNGPPPPVEVSCTEEGRGDWTCDNVTNILDVVAAIDYIFRTGAPPCDPCTDGS